MILFSRWCIGLLVVVPLLQNVLAANEFSFVKQDGVIYKCSDLNGKGIYRRCDGPNLAYTFGMSLQGKWNQGDFDSLEKVYKKWCSSNDRFPDGTWKLDAIRAALIPNFLVWKRWDNDQTKFAEWRKRYPSSIAEALTEAMFWQQYGRFARDAYWRGTVSPDSDRLADERYSKGLERLENIETQRNACPLWYPLKIAALVDLDRPTGEIKGAYEEGVTAFPGYLSIYYEAARALLPWEGGSAASYDRFAIDAARRSNAIEGIGMYARLYAYRDREVRKLPTLFVPGHPVSWARMKVAFDDLSSHYPQSPYILNLMASFACRAADGVAYKKARLAAGRDVMDAAWVQGYGVEVCDARYGLDSGGQ